MVVLTEKQNLLITQFIRYAIVGGIATVVDMSVLYWVTEHFGVHYLISSVIAFLIGLATNYTLCLAYVFHSRKLSNPWVEFGIFSVIGVLCLGLNTLILWSLTDLIGVYYMLSKAIAVSLVLVFNFSLRKYILFN